MVYVKSIGKTKGGIRYLGIYKSVREGKKVRQVCLKYLGREDKFTATEIEQYKRMVK